MWVAHPPGPLQDIANTHQIVAVVFNGELYEEKDLQTMCEYVKY